MTRKWDAKLQQWRDRGKFGGNDNAAAAGGMTSLQQPVDTPGRSVDADGTVKHVNADGKLHREDGPAYENPRGDKMWFLNGKRQRVELCDGTVELYKNGRLHCADGPAIVFGSGDKHYYQNGHLHREDGPAIVSRYGNEYHLHGRSITQDEFAELQGYPELKQSFGSISDVHAGLEATHPPSNKPEVARQQAQMLTAMAGRLGDWTKEHSDEMVGLMLSRDADEREQGKQVLEHLTQMRDLSDIARGRAAWIRENVLGESQAVHPATWKYGFLDQDKRRERD